MAKTSRWVLLAAISVLALMVGCGDDGAKTSSSPPTTAAPSPAEQYVANASKFVDAADWEAAKGLTIELSEFAFTPKEFSLEAGKPYILKVSNKGAVKHEFTAGEFFRTAATRKAETAQSEVKVPFFTEVEVFAGQTVEIYLIPLIPGTYKLVCEIAGHLEAGMSGTITVTGETPTSPAPQLADVASGPWIQDGPAMVEAADWDAAKELTVGLSEFAFTPKELNLEAGKPYILKVSNKGAVKHEFTAEEFFASVAFRKAEDASGEFKAPAPREIEVFPGKEIAVYLIPTKAGSYKLVCEIEGHLEAGMSGTITVAAAG